MPTFENGSASIYFEEYGSGYPLLIFAPGGLRSQIGAWRRSPARPDRPPPWMDPTRELASDFRVIAMDQRNAGRSVAPIRADDDWGTYACDHLALLDHLGIARAHVMGGCIGSSFSLRLCRDAPERISAAVLQNPIGLSENRALFAENFQAWRESIREMHPDVDPHVLEQFEENLHVTDFVFSVTREDVRRCNVPLFVMPGDDGPHPAPIGEEIARLAPRAEILTNWKGPKYLDDAIARVRDFLKRNTHNQDLAETASA
jgi:pimeloyl-ACP methyl ester carboxylesterase